MFVIVIVLLGISINLNLTASLDIKINDNTPQNHLIADLKLYDSYHSLSDETIKYNLVSNQKINTLFKMHGNGRLYAAKLIDREIMCSTIEQCCSKQNPCVINILVAMKSQSMMEPKTFECRIIIEDVNDFAPQFPKTSFNLQIKESDPIGSLYPLPTAKDLDSEKFDIKDYNLVDRSSSTISCFILDKQHGKSNLNLQLIHNLDRENVDKYKLELIAIDKGFPAKTATLKININVIDVNDNSPVLKQKNYVAQIKEGIYYTEPILTIEATDADIGENGKLVFKIIDENPQENEAEKYFRINPNNGKISLKQQLDYEKREKHKFLVLVSNPKASHLASVTASVLINVESFNDEKPEIIVNYLHELKTKARLKENGKKSEFVALVTVSDKDKGQDGEVECRLMNYNEIFEMQKKEVGVKQWQYTIFTKAFLDRETKEFYNLELECKDKGLPVQKTKSEIKIEVEDENDNAPKIDVRGLNNIIVKEKSPVGTLITQIKASDLDSGKNGELIFSITSLDENVQSWLQINPKNGEISTKTVIDREQTPGQPINELLIEITVSDCGTPRSQLDRHRFVIKIVDVNDNPPKFEMDPMRFSIVENNPPRHTLGEIVVTDEDVSGELRVMLKERTDQETSPFILFRKDGRLYLNTTRALDWEKERNFSLKIIANDGKGYESHTTTATILIQVEDENDNKPEIIFPTHKNYTIPRISYQEPPGFAFITINAKDNDSPDTANGKLYFHLTKAEKNYLNNGDIHNTVEYRNYNNLFMIHQTNGKISITRSMTKSDIGTYQVQVIVSDSGNPPKKAWMNLKIEIDNSIPHSKGIYDNNYNNDVDDEGFDRYGNYNNNRGFKGYFGSKEGLLVFSLIVLIFFLLICVLMMLYMRHYRGMFPMMPDILGECKCNYGNSNRNDNSSSRYNGIRSAKRMAVSNNKNYIDQSQMQQYQHLHHQQIINPKSKSQISLDPFILTQSPLIGPKYLSNPNHSKEFDHNTMKTPYFMECNDQPITENSNNNHLNQGELNSIIAMHNLPTNNNIDAINNNQYRQFENMINYYSFQQQNQQQQHHNPSGFYGDINTNTSDVNQSNYEKLFYNQLHNNVPVSTAKLLQNYSSHHSPLIKSSKPKPFYDLNQSESVPISMTHVDCGISQKIVNNIDSHSSDSCLKQINYNNKDEIDEREIHSMKPNNSNQFKSNATIDTYAVSFPKEQSTFV